MPTYLAKIKDSKLKLDQPSHLNLFLSKVKDWPSVLVRIEKRHNIRSLRHNAYYRGYVLPELVGETGYTDFEMHGLLKQMFCKREYYVINGKEYPRELTTRYMDSKEFSEFVDKAKIWGATERGIIWMDEQDFLAVN